MKALGTYSGEGQRKVVISARELPVTAGERLTTINAMVNGVLPVDVEIDDASQLRGRWHASLSAQCLLTRTRVGGNTTSRARRTSAHLKRDAELYYTAVWVRAGAVEVQQCGDSLELTKNQFALLSSQHPYDLIRRPGWVVADTVSVPGWMLSGRLSRPERFTQQRYEMGDGMELITMRFLNILMHEMHRVPAAMVTPLTLQLVDMLALSFASQGRGLISSESSVRHALTERIRRFIDARIFDPDLSPATIAGSNGISERYLYKIFQDLGERVSDYIRQRRLAAFRRALEDPLQVQRSVAEIGYAHGFRSASQLAKAYRRRYGESPRESRQRVLARMGALIRRTVDES
jgi:AraC-like DNA-binding protein